MSLQPTLLGPTLLGPTLLGPTLRVRPMTPADVEPLSALAADPALWAQHPEPDRWQRPVFQRFADGALACGGGLVVEDRESGALVGASRYYGWDPAARSVVIGYTFLIRARWGGGTNAELKRLMIDHAFTFADEVWFLVGLMNLRSRRAVEKLGAREVRRDEAAGRVEYRLLRGDRAAG